MISIIKDNYVKEEDRIFQVTCPNCKSEFEFQIEDLKLIEKEIDGKRIIDCPCCGKEFNTSGIGVGAGDVNKNQPINLVSTRADGSDDLAFPRFSSLLANAKMATYPIKENTSKVDENQDFKRETLYSEIKEIEIKGEKWWQCLGPNQNKKEDRKLKVGDAIVYFEKKCPEERPVIIIKSFDFPGDIAARAVVGMLPFKHIDGHVTNTYYSDFAPGFDTYRLAKDEEVRQFLIDYKDKCEGLLAHDFKKLRDMGIERYNKILYEIYQTDGLAITEGD